MAEPGSVLVAAEGFSSSDGRRWDGVGDVNGRVSEKRSVRERTRVRITF